MRRIGMDVSWMAHRSTMPTAIFGCCAICRRVASGQVAAAAAGVARTAIAPKKETT